MGYVRPILDNAVHQDEEEEEEDVDTGTWVSEMAIWVKWTHVGPLRATVSSEFIKVDTAKLAFLFCTTPPSQLLRKFAILAMALASEPHFVTDMPMSETMVSELIIRAYK